MACAANHTENAVWYLQNGFELRAEAMTQIVTHRNWTLMEYIHVLNFEALAHVMHSGWTAGLIWLYAQRRLNPAHDTPALFLALTHAPMKKRKLYADFIYELNGERLSSLARFTLQHITREPEARAWFESLAMR